MSTASAATVSSPPVVIMLPCAAGFPKQELADELQHRGFPVLAVFVGRPGTFGSEKIAATWDSLETTAAELIDREVKQGRRVILQGWSRGGYAALKVATLKSSELAGVAVFAAAGSPDGLERIRCPTLLFHNQEDRMVPFNVSEENQQRIARSTLLKSDAVGGNNHQCNEFVLSCVDWVQHISSTGATPSDV